MSDQAKVAIALAVAFMTMVSIGIVFEGRDPSSIIKACRETCHQQVSMVEPSTGKCECK